MAGFHKVVGSGPKDRRHPNDYYPTPPGVTRALLARETFLNDVLEPCAGAGHVVHELELHGYGVLSNELYPQQGGFEADERQDFLGPLEDPSFGCRSIVTNPPYRQAGAFVRRAIDAGFKKHAWLLRFQFVESVRRFQLFKDHPPRRLWVFSRRVQVSERGLVDPCGGMIVYAWWVWERGYRGHPELRWIEPDAVKKKEIRHD